MRKLLPLIIIFTLWVSTCFAGPEIFMQRRVGVTNYFGYQDSLATPTGGNLGLSNQWVMNKTVNYTSPCTGTVSAFYAYARLNSGSANIRMALYSTDATPAKICESDEIAVTGASYSWHKSGSVTGTCTVSNAITYKVGFTTDAANSGYMSIIFETVTSGDMGLEATDYTGGWPATLADGANSTFKPAVVVEILCAG